MSIQQIHEAVGVRRVRRGRVYEIGGSEFPIQGPIEQRRVKTEIALAALEQYRLVDVKDTHRGESYLSITDEGRDFLAFLDTPEGTAFQEDLRTGVHQLQHEVPDGLYGY
jgi:hypothetical protein